jgi:hypothetical protein
VESTPKRVRRGGPGRFPIRFYGKQTVLRLREAA